MTTLSLKETLAIAAKPQTQLTAWTVGKLDKVVYELLVLDGQVADVKLLRGTWGELIYALDQQDGNVSDILLSSSSLPGQIKAKAIEDKKAGFTVEAKELYKKLSRFALAEGERIVSIVQDSDESLLLKSDRNKTVKLNVSDLHLLSDQASVTVIDWLTVRNQIREIQPTGTVCFEYETAAKMLYSAWIFSTRTSF